MSSSPYKASLIVAPSKAEVPQHLNPAIVPICLEAIAARGCFTIALSGGSLPSFLSTLPDYFSSNDDDDPHYDKWHVILADERCVPSTDKDSNLGALQTKLLSRIPKIPASQVYGINESLLATTSSSSSTEEIAQDYETNVVRKVLLEQSGGCLDLAVLGFGPDGHTCSLFPHHALLDEQTKWVAPIEDSPKPPPKRITLTYPVLNTMTRHVIFCGAGGSKSPILQKVFSVVKKTTTTSSSTLNELEAVMTDPAPFPCAGVLPNTPDGTEKNTLTWVVDKDAMEGVVIEDISSS